MLAVAPKFVRLLSKNMMQRDEGSKLWGSYCEFAGLGRIRVASP